MARRSEVDDGGTAAGGDFAHLGEFLPGGGEADLQALGVTDPALAACFVDAGDRVVADLGQPRVLGGVGAQQRAADAGFSELAVSLLCVRFKVRVPCRVGDGLDHEAGVAVVDAGQGVRRFPVAVSSGPHVPPVGLRGDGPAERPAGVRDDHAGSCLAGCLQPPGGDGLALGGGPDENGQDGQPLAGPLVHPGLSAA